MYFRFILSVMYIILRTCKWTLLKNFCFSSSFMCTPITFNDQMHSSVGQKKKKTNLLSVSNDPAQLSAGTGWFYKWAASSVLYGGFWPCAGRQKKKEKTVFFKTSSRQFFFFFTFQREQRSRIIFLLFAT